MNVYERIFKLWASISKMIVDGARDPEKVAELLQTIVDGSVATFVYLRRLFESETIVIDETDGTETFESSGLFTGGVYGLKLPPTLTNPTLKTKVSMWEMILDGTFAKLFGSFGEKRGCLTESQVVMFVRKNKARLRTDPYGTFFEIKGGFVASVRFRGDGRLKVYVDPFSDDDVWDAECQHRLVAPQLES